MTGGKKHRRDIKRRNGTIRTARLSKDLLTSPFRIDDRNPWDVLAYIASYLEHINYYNIENRVAGNWKKLVEKDPLIYMAIIINEPTDDLEKLEKLIRSLGERTLRKKSRRYSDRDHIIEKLLHWWQKIYGWSIKLKMLNEKNLAVKIKDTLENGIMFGREYIVSTEGELDIKNLQKAARKTDDIGIILDEILHDFQKVIAHIKETTKKHFQQSLFSNDNHLPNNAMYIAFTLLFHKIQDKLNGMSQRHLDFYYKQVLQQQNKKGNPSRAIVNFDLQPMVANTLIPKGTKLSAAKILGSKTEILFETSKDIMAYQSELVNIQTLLINSNDYVAIGTDEPIVSSIMHNQLFRYGKDQTPRQNWYVFGANKRTVQDSKMSDDKSAKIGFIIGTPALFLSEGRREISLRLNLEKETSRQTFWRLLNEIKCNKNIAMTSVVSMVFDKAFNIYHTHTDGWVACDYLIEFNEAKNYFKIKILLDISHPALEPGVAIEEVLTWPSLKVELNEYAPVFAYSFFKEVEIETINIDVSVRGMKNLSVYNSVGKMPPGKPFELFGPQPKKGDYFMVGHSELFKKQITKVALELDWETVPADYGGFETHYSGYGEAINNHSFKVQFSVLSNGYWFPSHSEGMPELDLFSTTNCLTPEGYHSEQLDADRILDFENFYELGLSNDYALEDPLLYSVTSQGGFIKITFTSPDFGFGDELYQKEFTEIATFNAKNKRQLSYPNKPFIPKVKGAMIHYSASDELSFVEKIASGSNSNMYAGEFKHITPYIVQDVIVDQMVKKHTLLPNFTEEGYLGMGLMGVRSRTEISIYINFLRSSTTVQIKDNSLKWEYFSHPEWQEFEASSIIRDDTEGFLKSGIVQLIIPHVEAEDRGIHPDILWIRASTNGDVEHYPKIKGIYLNAVETICTSEDPLIIGQKINSQSIDKVEGKFPDIKQVYQAAESYGGRIPEEGNQFYTRVSERLRHKGRAVTLWDYERLVLERFDDVLIAKCTSFNENFEPVPGHVKVVVLSTRWTKNNSYYFSKMKLQRMEDYLNSISSSFINIEVINPIVEYLLVNCKVVFQKLDLGLNYHQKLNEDISEYLSPIARMDSNNGGIGGTIMPSTVANYVENLSYIERLEKLNIEHIIRKKMNDYTLEVNEKEEIISAQSPWSILVPAREHRVVVKEDIKALKVLENLEVGIGTIGVGVDFILGDE